MTWTEQLAEMAVVLTDPAAFGEPVTLPDGETLVMGIFAPQGVAPRAPWPELALGMRLSQQPNPVVHLRALDAATLAEQATLLIRGTAYTILRLDQDGTGLTQVELMPATRSGADDLDRWR